MVGQKGLELRFIGNLSSMSLAFQGSELKAEHPFFRSTKAIASRFPIRIDAIIINPIPLDHSFINPNHIDESLPCKKSNF